MVLFVEDEGFDPLLAVPESKHAKGTLFKVSMDDQDNPHVEASGLTQGFDSLNLCALPRLEVGDNDLDTLDQALPLVVVVVSVLGGVVHVMRIEA